MQNVKKSDRLNGKDLMNVGIFTAVNLVIAVAGACTIGMIPMGFMLYAGIGPILLGIPMMLYFTRIKKFGMVLIFQIVDGVLLLLTGMGPGALLCGVVTALAAEGILWSGHYQSAKRAVLAYAVLGLASCANYIQWINASVEWLNEKAVAYGETYMYTVASYFSYWWTFPALLAGAFVGGLLGGLLGRAVLKKHFVRSGLL